MNTTTKRKTITSFISLLLAMLIGLAAFIMGPTKTTASAAMPSSSSIDKGIDYSGKGTIINGNLASESAQVSGNIVKIPIYKGSYSAPWYNG